METLAQFFPTSIAVAVLYVLHSIVSPFHDLNALTAVMHPVLHLDSLQAGSSAQQQTVHTAAVMTNAGP